MSQEYTAKELGGRFKELDIPRIHIHAINVDGHWVIGAERKTNSFESSEGLKKLYCALARHAGIAAGAPKDCDPLDFWIDILAAREDPDRLLEGLTHHAPGKPPIVQLLARKSSDLCLELAGGQIELAITQDGNADATNDAAQDSDTPTPDSETSSAEFFDLNNPPKIPYEYREFPEMLYHHETRRNRVVQSEKERSAYLAQGWRREAYPREEAPEAAAEVNLRGETPATKLDESSGEDAGPPEVTNGPTSVATDQSRHEVQVSPQQNAELEKDIEQRKAERKKLRDDYQAECKMAGEPGTHETIAQGSSRRWKSRTQVDKWLQCDPRYDGEADRLIRQFLTSEIKRLRESRSKKLHR